MGERLPSDSLRFGNTMEVGSSTGWTDEKHMRYITSLEESFVNQLYNGDVSSMGLLCQYPDAWHKTSYSGNGRNTKVDQGYWGMPETDRGGSRSSQAEYPGSPSCSGYQENGIASFMNDDTSTNCPQQEGTMNHTRSKNTGRFAASYLRWHGRSLPRRTESSGQNFIDGETEGSGEYNRGCRERRQKQKAGSASSSREGQ
ncbi:hypothetical protein EJB05_06255 [Eragrostis curvula]|uniref:Uncharacterized protein n=1 Tax=Eragrostis curvula TaxID=38414 RepID=A0A5J9WDA1_9POAL|nr:hypothetical protein EJB05_06222 [Eragrostis curvula]TVU46704.1 hypothetical protein EJB05_06255 [Eragrostis curvula]